MTLPDACVKCKLYQQGCKTHLMSGHGSDNPDIIFIGEAPGCVTGNSLIEVAFRDKSKYPNGVPIKDLVGMHNFYVYSFDVQSNTMVLGEVLNVWNTGVKPVYEVVYEWKYAEGSVVKYLTNSIKVTSNHPFLLKPTLYKDPFKGANYGDKHYTSIDDGLVVGASLQPFHRHNKKYAVIGPYSKSMQQESRFLLEFKLGRALEKFEECHHKDRNKLNDSWDNLELHTKSSHAALHLIEDGNPMHKPEIKAKHSKAMKSERYRNAQSIRMKNILSNPENYTARLRQIDASRFSISATVKKRFLEPQYYYNYLRGRQKYMNLSDEWVRTKFETKFPSEDLPIDNHKVISIQYAGLEEVYDMEVKYYHNFAANGIFVHNSDEDVQGIPFVGKSGQLLRTSIAEMELPLDKIRFTNVVRCRPPDNRTPTAKEIKSCLPFLVDELEQRKPRVVVLLGNTPLKAVLGLTGISSYQGQGAIERDGVKYVPSYHPSFILRQGAGQSAMEDWLRSMADIINAYEGLTKPDAADAHYEYTFPMYIDELERMRDELLSNPAELIACDIESVRLQLDAPDNRIITIAFANSTKAWSLPVDHKDSWWNAEERRQVHQIIEDILTKGRIINHNIKFDCKMIRHFLNIDFVPAGDTIQLSRLVSPDVKEHGLKRLAGIHLGMFDYNAELEAYIAQHPECDYGRGGNYGNIPLEILLPYGGKDVSATRMLHDKLYEQLTPAQRVLYDQMIILADYAVGRIEENGFKLDYDLIRRYLNVYRIIMNYKYMPAMLEDEHVRLWMKAQNLYNKLDMAGIITKEKVGKQYECTLNYNGNSYRFNKSDWHEFYVLNRAKLDALDVDYQLKRKLPEIEFNPNSSLQVAPIIYTYKNLVPDKRKIVRTETGGYSVKRAVLKEVVYDMNGEGRYDKFMDDYMNWKLLSSITSKTFKSMLSEHSDWYAYDGRVRSTYTIGGAMTGRTSSAEPNLQNIPAIEKEPGTVLQYLPAKNAFTHTFPGGGLAMLDYSGMELRVMCSIANIRGMIDVFNRKGDVHKYTSSLIYRKPEDQITKFERYRGKWCNWSLLYLGNWWTLVRLYRINGVTEDEAKRVAALYFEAFPELSQYHKTVESFLVEHGYVESVFGRRLSLPAIYDTSETVRNDTLRTAVNFPIQGVASDTLMVAFAIITQLLRGKGFRSMFVNTVHDSLVIDYHPDERDYVVKLSTEVMENVVDYASEWMPGIDFSWLKVPLVSDVDYGSHYGSYGRYQPIISECGCEMVMAGDVRKGLIDDKEDNVLTYECPNCDEVITKPFKPLLYNNTHPQALHVRQQWQRVLYSNNYDGPRRPRLLL